MRRWNGVGMMLVVGTAACSAGVGTRIQEPIRPSGAWEVTALALLPTTAVSGSEEAAGMVSQAALQVLSAHLPNVQIMDPQASRDRLGRAGAGAALAQLIRDYEQSGVADLARVDSVVAAVGVDHFLQLRVEFAETEVWKEDVLADDISEEDRREVVLVARLWTVGEPAPVWEGTARGLSETGFLATTLPDRDEMIVQVVDRLLSRMPLLDPGDISAP